MDIAEEIKKSWKWIWNSDSIWSWGVSLILAFIIVKFIFFPLLTLITATPLPLVVVESGSMEHPEAGFIGNNLGLQSSFNSWWSADGTWYESINITKNQVENWPLKTGFDKGDIIIVWGRFNPKIGDVIIFNANTRYPIIHRIISENPIETKGDNNAGQLEIEKNIPKNAIIGKAVFRIPKLGWIKLAFVSFLNLFLGNSK